MTTNAALPMTNPISHRKAFNCLRIAKNATIPTTGINTAGPLVKKPSPRAKKKIIFHPEAAVFSVAMLFQNASAEIAIQSASGVSGVTTFAAINGANIVPYTIDDNTIIRQLPNMLKANKPVIRQVTT